MTMIITMFRDAPPGGPHGDVHTMTSTRGKPRPKTVMCGKTTDGMRKIGPFRGFGMVLCPDCDRRFDA